MKACLVAYNGRELHKILELKIIKYRYFRGCIKRLATQIGLFKIIGIKRAYKGKNKFSCY
jgi:hypothetical protein